MNNSVYFARPLGDRSRIKIGCAYYVPSRVYELRFQWGTPFELLATYPGYQSTERRFHLMFLDDWLGQEFFTPSEKLLVTIEEINAGAFDASALPEWRKLPRLILRKPFLAPPERVAA